MLNNFDFLFKNLDVYRVKIKHGFIDHKYRSVLFNKKLYVIVNFDDDVYCVDILCCKLLHFCVCCSCSNRHPISKISPREEQGQTSKKPLFCRRMKNVSISPRYLIHKTFCRCGSATLRIQIPPQRNQCSIRSSFGHIISKYKSDQGSFQVQRSIIPSNQILETLLPLIKRSPLPHHRQSNVRLLCTL